MKILAVCGANGSWLYPLKEWLVGNYEPRSIYHTPKEVQWKSNFPKIPIWDKKTYGNHHIGEVNMIVGAPNCGHSSILALSNSKFRDAKDDESFRAFFSEVQNHQPEVFIMENLPKSAKNAEELASELGYYTIGLNISMFELGNSQKNRKRYIMVGVNMGLPNYKKIAKKLTRVKMMAEHKTAGELIKGLAFEKTLDINLGHIRESLDDIVTIYGGKKITLMEARQYWRDNPEAKRFDAENRKYTNAPGVYRNLKDEYPAVARKADRQFNHLGYQMSPRELARIQGIPDGFKIHFPLDISDKKVRNYWINKGRVTATKCPPYEFGAWIADRVRALLASKLL